MTSQTAENPIRTSFADFISPTEELLEEARRGRMFILVDDEDRENEGDLVIPAQFATPDAINFMARYARGLICLSMTRARVDQLGLPLMAQSNGTRHQTAFTVSPGPGGPHHQGDLTPPGGEVHLVQHRDAGASRRIALGQAARGDGDFAGHRSSSAGWARARAPRDRKPEAREMPIRRNATPPT